MARQEYIESQGYGGACVTATLDPTAPTSEQELGEGRTETPIAVGRPSENLNADVLRAMGERVSVAGVAGVATFAARARGLFLVRESDEWDLELFNAMREQTYQNHRDVPAVEAIRRVGLAPMGGSSFTVTWNDRGAEVHREVIVEVVRHGSAKAYLFYFEGYWHLWSQASAAKVSESGFNDFSTLLIEVIERLSPRELYAANLSRLIRSQFEARRLSVALTGRVDVIIAKDQRFDLCGPNEQVGFMMLAMLGWCAAMERDAIVQRLLAGKIAKWRRKEWPFGDATVPFGYTFDKKSKRLIPVESLRDAVREMMLILISDAPMSQMARELDRVGARSMRRNRKTAEYTAFSSMTNIGQAIRALYAWAPIWCTGEFLFRYANPIKDMTELSGVPIVRYPDKGGDMGELQMLYQVEVPEGGWAEPEVLEAFSRKAMALSADLLGKTTWTTPRPVGDGVERVSRNPVLHTRVLSPELMGRRDRVQRTRRHTSRAKRQITPLTGRNWVDGSWFYELQMSGTNVYRLVRWPITSLQAGVDKKVTPDDRGTAK